MKDRGSVLRSREDGLTEVGLAFEGKSLRMCGQRIRLAKRKVRVGVQGRRLREIGPGKHFIEGLGLGYGFRLAQCRVVL